MLQLPFLFQIETPAKKPEVRGAPGNDAKVVAPKAAVKKDETNGDALKKIALNQAPTVQVLTAPERKLERAKKFNIQPQLSVDEAKKLRAERFVKRVLIMCDLLVQIRRATEGEGG